MVVERWAAGNGPKRTRESVERLEDMVDVRVEHLIEGRADLGEPGRHERWPNQIPTRAGLIRIQ
jgi:hypothetical protein